MTIDLFQKSGYERVDHKEPRRRSLRHRGDIVEVVGNPQWPLGSITAQADRVHSMKVGPSGDQPRND